ncbi:MAG: DoxX family protein [Pirellulales bacterium]
MIIALRLVIGFHFYKEGSKKISSGNFSSAGFLRNAKGPFAENFRGLIDDIYGYERLNIDKVKARWDMYKQQAVVSLQLDENGGKKAETLLTAYNGRIDIFFAENQGEIDEYFLEVERWHKKRTNQANLELASQADLIIAKDRELFGKLNGWTAQLSKTEASFIEDLNGLRTAENPTPLFRVPNPNTSQIDVIVTYVVLGAGICLLLGFATRIASLAAAGFLLQVVASQWPGAYGADPVYYQSVEVMALLFLAAVGAGKYAGLDYIIYGLCCRCCKSCKRSANNTDANKTEDK